MADHEHHHSHDPHGAPSDYGTWVMSQRHAKDEYFRESSRSPIPPSERESFDGLGYYPVDEAMRFESVALGPLPDELPTETEVQTSDGAVRQGRRVGTLEFEIDGQVQQLVALRIGGADDGSVFVPFRDATNGPETYGAGRYLDLPANDDGTYDLDFNLAYAPFCAYSASYSCPLPPRENRLTVRIEAGERNT